MKGLIYKNICISWRLYKLLLFSAVGALAGLAVFMASAQMDVIEGYQVVPYACMLFSQGIFVDSMTGMFVFLPIRITSLTLTILKAFIMSAHIALASLTEKMMATERFMGFCVAMLAVSLAFGALSCWISVLAYEKRKAI